jgi:hypothetical protein
MAEREGFEPPELSLNGFQDRRLKPLGHLSVPETSFSTHRLRRMTALWILQDRYFFLGSIRSVPPMYVLSTSGTITVPSGC